MERLRIRVAAAALVLLGLSGCADEGPAEKAGRKVDEAVKELREGSEGALERLGRETDEAVEETREAVDALTEEGRKK